MNELPLSLRRLIAISLLLLLFAFIGIYGTAPWFEHIKQRQTRVEMLQRQLLGNQTLLANESAIDDELARIELLSGEQALLFSSTKPALAAADLRELIGEVVADSGGQLVSVQEYEADSLPGTRAIGLRAHLTGEAQNLSDILYALETARPAIFIDKLTVSTSRRATARNNRRLRARPNSSVVRRNSLDIRLDLSAYIVAGL
jgi:general secretion pathway protein M